MRYWVSWWSGNYADEGCTKPEPGAFAYDKFWVSGQRDRVDHGLSADKLKQLGQIEDADDYDAFLDTHARDDCSICAVIDADNPDAVWERIIRYFPDAVLRFCEERALDYDPRGPGSRFQ